MGNKVTSQNQLQPARAVKTHIGDAIKYLRDRLGLSQRAAARELGISHIHLNNIENGKVSPTADMLEKFYSTWGIDVYMVAVAKFSSKREIPAQLADSVRALAAAWDGQIERILRERLITRMDESCSESSE
jgi:transcriptional regulator with XRE-family HTH domain